ncbi:hypothetical protein [Streptomyces avermitilis]|uniref:hypothetical protein n=1 Tax=Streptomyces avermitilis TaxID=33903 RepID=UPI003818FE6A
MRITLLTVSDCPNAPLARERIGQASALLPRKNVMARLGDRYSALTRHHVRHPVIGLEVTF